MRAGPAAPSRTWSTGWRARTTPTRAAAAAGRPKPPATIGMQPNATTSMPTYSQRVRASPMRTARVRLPDAVSPGMSRRLLITSSAVAHSPTGTDATSGSADSSSVCT